MTGAPGSRWSGVSKGLYFSHHVDQSDFSVERTYYHDADGEGMAMMHCGAYFDPGMEFGEGFDDLTRFTVEELEREFDRPFKPNGGIKIIKSHCFAYQLDFLKENWPDCPIITVLRTDDACLDWWKRCGHFNITYPKYDYYVDLDTMMKHINHQNNGIKKFIEDNETIKFAHSNDLVRHLGIQSDKLRFHDYNKQDVIVQLYWSNT